MQCPKCHGLSCYVSKQGGLLTCASCPCSGPPGGEIQSVQGSTTPSGKAKIAGKG